MAGVNVPITISSNADDASAQVQDLGANYDQMGLQGVRAARDLTNGVSGLLSAEQNVYNAQQRVNIAQINYTLTVRQYGEGSIQAAKALTSLQQAQESVTIAQDQLNLRFIQFALSTGPQIYTAISRVIAASMGMTLANYQETASWYAKAGAILFTTAALTGGLLLFGGLLSGAAAVSQTNQMQTINQTNNFNNTGGMSPTQVAQTASASLASAAASSTRP